jgi:hypothetical protein
VLILDGENTAFARNALGELGDILIDLCMYPTSHELVNDADAPTVIVVNYVNSQNRIPALPGRAAPTGAAL